MSALSNRNSMSLPEDSCNAFARVKLLVVLALIAIAAALLLPGSLAKPKVSGDFTPQDVRQIRQVACRHRWELIPLSLRSGNFALFSALCVSDPARGQISESEEFPEWGADDLGSVNNAPLRAYVISGKLEYGLERSINGWQIFSLGLR